MKFELEVVKFNVVDVITASNDDEFVNEENGLPLD